MMAMTTSNSIRVNAVFFPDYFPFIFISVPELNPDSNQNPEPFGSSSPLNLMVGRSAGARTPDQWLKSSDTYFMSLHFSAFRRGNMGLNCAGVKFFVCKGNAHRRTSRVAICCIFKVIFMHSVKQGAGRVREAALNCNAGRKQKRVPTVYACKGNALAGHPQGICCGRTRENMRVNSTRFQLDFHSERILSFQHP